MDGVHVYLHVLARLEALAAHGAGVRQLARGVHVEDVLLEVAIVAVELAARRARGLAGLARRLRRLAAPATSCRRRRLSVHRPTAQQRPVLASPPEPYRTYAHRDERVSSLRLYNFN